MRKPLVAGGLILLGCVLGVGLVQVGRQLERDSAPPAASAADLPPMPRATVEQAKAAPLQVAPQPPPAARVQALNDDPAELVARAKVGYETAKNAVLKQEELKIDELLLLGYAAASDADRALRDHIAAARKKVQADPFARLLDPSAKAPALKDRRERGLLGMQRYLLASIGEPDERAIEQVTEFAARDENEYALCHQVLALGWYEATGRALTDELQSRRSVLLARIEQEQKNATAFSDLFAERAVMLLLYGAPDRAETRRWVDVLLDAQQSDGTWGLQSRTLSFDGEAQPVTPDTMHTVTLAMVVLRRFIDTSAR